MKEATIKALKTVGGLIARNPKKVILVIIAIVGAFNPELATKLTDALSSLSDVLLDVVAETPTEAITEAPVAE